MNALLMELVFMSASPSHGVWVAQGYPGEWESAASVLTEAGVDHLLPCLLYGITPAYSSNHVPDSPAFPPDTAWIDEMFSVCGENGIEVHSWVVLWRVSRADSLLVEELAREGRLQITSGNDTLPWLCPTDPGNLEFQGALLEEMMDRYNLDGVHLDYIRYPDGNSCFCEGCRARFQQHTRHAVYRWPDDVLENGPLHGEYADWRRGRVTNAVSFFSGLVRARGLPVSAAVFSNLNYGLDCGQDWAEWCGLGLLDRIYHMNYFSTAAEVEAAVRTQRSLLPRCCYIVSGLGSSIGSLAISTEEATLQVEASLRAGADGICHFHLNTTLLRMLPMMRIRESAR